MSAVESRRERREYLSQADEALRRVIAAKPTEVDAPPSDLADPEARRRGLNVRGW